MAGYVRQSLSSIVDGEDIIAAPLNAEFNQLQAAFNNTTGHPHDGSAGNGPQINLTSAVTGYLPAANGGTGAKNYFFGTVAPTANDDSVDGFFNGSIWLDAVANRAYMYTGGSGAGVAEWTEFTNTALDATLTALAGLSTAADKVPYFTGTDTAALADFPSYGRTLVANTTAGDARSDLGLVIGTDVQAQDAELAAIAGLTSAADSLPYFTGSGTAALATFTTAGRNLVDDADASAQRTTLGLAIGTDVQAYDSGLAALAAFNTNGILVQTANNTFAARTLTAPAAGITVSNGDGVSGNPTLALANDLAALEGMSGTGIAVHTTTDTWTERTITGTANEITLTNGNGVSGNPTVSLPSALTFTGKTVTGGTFSAPTISGAYTISGGTDIAVADGGTGASTAANARTNLGVYDHVIDSVHGAYTTHAALSTAIPLDDTIPQVTEGDEILSVVITPKTTTNKLRVRVRINGTLTTSIQALIAALFVNGGANAVRASYGTVGSVNFEANVTLEYEYTPGSTSAQTLSVRVGAGGAAGPVYLNGSTASRIFGGTSASTITVEEIRA